jgi:hypothetical protein
MIKRSCLNQEMRTEFWSRNLWESGHSEKEVEDERIILRCALREVL